MPTNPDDFQLRVIGHIDRPDKLASTTYRIQPGNIEHAFYVTICDHMFEAHMRPFEMFLNTKDPVSFQWVSALMRLISSRFQEPGPFPTFIIDELKDNYDPQGGYFVQEIWLRPRGKGLMTNGVVAHLGLVLEYHCKALGLLKPPRKPRKKPVRNKKPAGGQT